jgi:hypothetical protein
LAHGPLLLPNTLLPNPAPPGIGPPAYGGSPAQPTSAARQAEAAIRSVGRSRFKRESLVVDVERFWVG